MCICVSKHDNNEVGDDAEGKGLFSSADLSVMEIQRTILICASETKTRHAKKALKFFVSKFHF